MSSRLVLTIEQVLGNTATQRNRILTNQSIRGKNNNTQYKLLHFHLYHKQIHFPLYNFVLLDHTQPCPVIWSLKLFTSTFWLLLLVFYSVIPWTPSWTHLLH